jgi:DNA-directed RNA polymerase subunit M/transcription elongation factor TFIIS
MAEVEYRRDGWPFCPQCGEDELYAFAMMGWRGDEPRPTLAECHAHEFCCYKCAWRGTVAPRG